MPRDVTQQRWLQQPPSGFSEPLRRYLQDIADAVNRMPWGGQYSSYSSTEPPNSAFSGVPGSLIQNVNQSSTVTKLWLKESGLGNTGWVSVLTA